MDLAMARALRLEGRTDREKFKELGWGLPREIRESDSETYFTVSFVPGINGIFTCLAFNRKCWSFDLVDRPETRPEIEPQQWNPESLVWPVKRKERPDLIFFHPPYFNKLADGYTKDSISTLSRREYLGFFQEFFPLAKEHSMVFPQSSPSR